MTDPTVYDPFDLFEYAPISLWEEDYSGIKRSFDRLRAQGVSDLAAYLDLHPSLIGECMQQIVVRRVNLETLKMFGAASQTELLTNLHNIFRTEMQQHFRAELLTLWAGEQSWAGEGVNHTLAGDALDILLHWRILPGAEENWERVLVTIDNITARKQAERRLRDLFEAAPISLWEEDYRDLKVFFDALRSQGVEDLAGYLVEHPEVVQECMARIRVLDVNQKTLALFGAESKRHLLDHLDTIFRGEMRAHFAEELLDLWQGRLAYTREGVNYALDGSPLQVQLDLRIMPGHAGDFGWVLVAIQDITARKKAEDYLYYLGTHDVLTGLHNRAYFQEALGRLQQGSELVSVIVADLNELKHANDSFGHEAGDNLIRRAAEVLRSAIADEGIIARVGGDEFIVLLPGINDEGVQKQVQAIRSMAELNNRFYRKPKLSFALGTATTRGDELESAVRRADDAMYKDKQHAHRRQ
jgi:diguanylate cyclase (GGDEF)-like protein/PAS domain S-box-containing protein